MLSLSPAHLLSSYLPALARWKQNVSIVSLSISPHHICSLLRKVPTPGTVVCMEKIKKRFKETQRTVIYWGYLLEVWSFMSARQVWRKDSLCREDMCREAFQKRDISFNKHDIVGCETWIPCSSQINWPISSWYIHGVFQVCFSSAQLTAGVTFWGQLRWRISGARELPCVNRLAKICCTVLEQTSAVSATAATVQWSRSRQVIWA